MENKYDLTTGPVRSTMIRFVLPYLLSCFLQTFYGMADLFVVGLYNGSATTSAVSIGSQVMHMLTVMIVGLAMGATVEIGHDVGAGDTSRAKKTVGTTVIAFAVLAVLLTLLLLALTAPITQVMMTPKAALPDTLSYLKICFAGIPFVVAYNVICSVYRGAGDSKSPMIFVGIACFVNVVLDFVFIGGCAMGASGAALATVIGQAVSAIIALAMMGKIGLGFRIEKKDIAFNGSILSKIFKVGVPISMQDGLIQIAFIVITVIANSRGTTVSASVGIVEKMISFMFLVPSAFLSAISAITAQNMGAGKAERARESLRFGLFVTFFWGLFCCILCQLFPESFVGIFSKDSAVILAGAQYLRAYVIDAMFAAIHFCFSGYFCGDQKSGISFLHNIVSVVAVRVPGAYLASRYFPDTLFPMGLAAPMGSLLSVLICVGFYVYYGKKERVFYG